MGSGAALGWATPPGTPTLAQGAVKQPPSLPASLLSQLALLQPAPAPTCSRRRLPGLRQRDQRPVRLLQGPVQAGGTAGIHCSRGGRGRRHAGATGCPTAELFLCAAGGWCPEMEWPPAANPPPASPLPRSTTSPSFRPCAGGPGPRRCWPPTAWALSRCSRSPAADRCSVTTGPPKQEHHPVLTW